MATDPASLLAKAKTALERRLDGDLVESYSIRGRNLRFVSLESLRTLIAELQREVEGAKRSDGMPFGYGLLDRRLS